MDTNPQVWDPVDSTEIATRLGVSVNAVRRWRERHDDFPQPRMLTIGPVWAWKAVADWARATGRLEDLQPPARTDGEPGA